MKVEVARMNNSIQKSRIKYIDYLRIFSIFAVVFLHTTGQNYYSIGVNSYAWKVFCFYDSFVRWCVPVFIMISGSLFLRKDIPLKVIFKKYVARLLTAYLCWGLIYVLLFSNGDFLSCLCKVIYKGTVHLWFIPMLIGLYMITPFLRLIVINQNMMRYYLLLSLLFASVIPTFTVLVNDLCGRDLVKVVGAFNGFISQMKLQYVLGYSGYFILGYYLSQNQLSQKAEKNLFGFGCLGFVFTILLQYVVAMKLQKPHEHYFGYLSFNVLLESIAVFLWFKNLKFKSPKVPSYILKLSQYSFGVYLVHPIFIMYIKTLFHFTTLSFNALISVPLIVVIIFCLSVVVSAILNHIPYAKKYIV